MANPPSKPPRGIKTPKETVSTIMKNCILYLNELHVEAKYFKLFHSSIKN